jgi:NAD(P)-dependent dehydrogenase (short-subunit alcohol dehydrogenase family)
MLDMEEADLRDLLHVHVKGTVVPTQHAGRYWRTEHRAGRTIRPAIVNTTSRAGLATRVPEIAWYSAAKGAVAAFTMAAALELAEFGIRVNAIAPHSFTRQDAAAAGVEYDPSKNQALAPDKVAPVVAWLASESSAPINGKIFWVEGGIVSHYERWRAGHTITTEGRWDAAAIGPALRAVGFEG